MRDRRQPERHLQALQEQRPVAGEDAPAQVGEAQASGRLLRRRRRRARSAAGRRRGAEYWA